MAASLASLPFNLAIAIRLRLRVHEQRKSFALTREKSNCKQNTRAAQKHTRVSKILVRPSSCGLRPPRSTRANVKHGCVLRPPERGMERGGAPGCQLIRPCAGKPPSTWADHGTRSVIFFGGYGYVTTQDGTSRSESLGLRRLEIERASHGHCSAPSHPCRALG